MDLETERRSNGPSRLPVDLLVELSHEGDEDVYEADAMDLGRGGIGLRASVLPEIGQRVRCRFELPGRYELCDTRGEVVWADDAGRFSGAFGVRFEEMDARTARALAAFAPQLMSSVPVANRASDIAFSSEPEAVGGRLVKLRLDGVGSAIEGEIVSQGGSISIEQSMPFLQIGRGAELEDAGMKTRAVLERVRLRVVNGTPRLVLELAPESPEAVALEERALAPTADATIQDEPLSALIAQSVSAPRSSTSSAHEARPVMQREREAPRVISRAEALAADEAAHEEPFLAQKARAFVQSAKPRLAKGALAVRTFALATFAKTGPWLVRVRDGIVAAWRLLASLVAERAPKLGAALGQAPRRRTAMPPAVAAAAPLRRARGAAPVVVPAPAVRLRTILLFVLAATAVGLAAYGLASGAEEPAELQIRPTSSTVVTPTAPILAAPVTIPETIEPIAPPEAAIEAPTSPTPATSSPGWDRAMPEPEATAGPMPPPSYPSIQDRRSTPTADGAPSAAEAPTQGRATMEFGASEVERGRTTTLRMSAAVQGIEGQADEGGFTITIRGALSLDRAAPLAAASSSIERASIINRGDHSVLTIRFVTGRTPAYRVVAHDAALDITIGR